MTANTNTNMGMNTNTTPRTEHSPLEQKAEAVREKLSSTLDSLEQKGQELFGVGVRDVKNELNKHPLAFSLVAGSVVLALGTGIGLAVYFSHQRKQRTFQARWNMIKKFWDHPEKLFN